MSNRLNFEPVDQSNFGLVRAIRFDLSSEKTGLLKIEVSSEFACIAASAVVKYRRQTGLVACHLY